MLIKFKESSGSVFNIASDDFHDSSYVVIESRCWKKIFNGYKEIDNVFGIYKVGV